MNNRIVSWVIFVCLCFIWGSSFILMKESKEGLTASQIAALRIFSAGLVFVPFAFFHFKKISKKKIPLVIIASLFGNLFPAFLYAAAIAKNLDSSLAGILNSLTPICVVIIGIVFFRDKIKTIKIIGVLISFLGLSLPALLQKNVHWNEMGNATLIVFATISYGININLVAHFLKRENPVYVATVSMAFLTIPCAIILWQQGFFQLQFDKPEISQSIIYSCILGIAGSAVATALFYTLVTKAGGLFASLVTYGIPFIALFWGFLDNEKITLEEIIGLLIILIGVYLATKRQKTET